MRFKAKIATPQALNSNNGKYRTHISTNYFYFSKGRIFYEEKANDELTGFFLRDGNRISSGTDYRLVRLFKYENLETWSSDSKFQAQFGNGTTFNLITSLWDGILLRIIHKRFWLLKNEDFLIKTAIPILFGAIVGAVFNDIGYSKGYQNGLEVGRLQLQDQNKSKPKDSLPDSVPFLFHP